MWTRVVAALTMIAFISPVVLAKQQPLNSPDLIRTYVERIPAGSKVKVTLVDGKRYRGVLMLVEQDHVVVRERKRVPEEPLRIPIERIADVELDQPGGGIGRAVAIGAAVGAGAALGVIAFLAAIFADD